jgi:ankyrin repeat protein
MYEHGNDIFACDKSDLSSNSLLHVAIRNANKNTAELLIKMGMNSNIKNKNGETPLHLAVSIKDQEKAEEIIEMMLLKGADPH